MSFLSLVGLRMLVIKQQATGFYCLFHNFFFMADIADILGVDQAQATTVNEKKPKTPVHPDPYANLPRYLRDIVDENNPPPKDLFEEKKC